MSVNAADLPQIAFSRNEINLEITSDDFIAVAGVKAETHIIFVDAIAAGQPLRLKWPGADVLLTSATTPDDSGNQFLTGDGGAAYVESIVPVLKSNFYIDRDFDVSYLGVIGGFATIALIAKKTGVIFNIDEQDYGDILTVLTDTAGVTEQLKPNFAHHVQIWLKLGVAFENIYQANLQLNFPFTGLTTKNIAQIIHSYLTNGSANNYGSDKPSLTAAAWQSCTKTLLEYYCRLGQYFGDTPEVKKLTTMPAAFINIGGLDVATAPERTLADYLRPSGVDGATLCLRQGSRTKRVQPAQPEFLYWINLTGATVIVKLRIELFWADGSQSFLLLGQSALAWQKYCVPVGFDQLNMGAMLPTGKLCTYYTAKITTAAGVALSATYTYAIDVYREYPRYFIYLNSLGGFQTLYTWGKGQAETERKKEDVKRLTTAAQAKAGGAIIENNIRIQKKYTVYTGYRTRRDVTLLDDFLLSGEKYLAQNGRLIPIGLTTDGIKEAPDGDNLNGASFTFYPLYDEVVFTDDTTAPETGINGGSDGAAAGYNAIIDRGNILDSVYADS